MVFALNCAATGTTMTAVGVALCRLMQLAVTTIVAIAMAVPLRSATVPNRTWDMGATVAMVLGTVAFTTQSATTTALTGGFTGLVLAEVVAIRVKSGKWTWAYVRNLTLD